MPFNIKATLEAVQNHLLKGAYLKKVQIGEPKAPPSEPLAAALFMNRVGIVLIFAGGDTRESHVVTLRVYRDMLAEPQESIELDLALAVSDLSSDLLGEFDLGATIMSIDAAGAHGTPYGAEWGYVDVGGRMYRIVDVTIPLIVDGSATMVP